MTDVMWFFYFPSPVLNPAMMLHNDTRVDAAGIHAAWTQQILHSTGVLFHFIIPPGKKMSHIVGVDFLFIHSGLFSQIYHAMVCVTHPQKHNSTF